MVATRTASESVCKVPIDHPLLLYAEKCCMKWCSVVVRFLLLEELIMVTKDLIPIEMKLTSLVPLGPGRKKKSPCRSSVLSFSGIGGAA